MIIEPMIVTDKIGRSIVLRNAEEDDAASLIKFMKITTGETPFLIREPDEFSLTIEQEKNFIKEQKDNPRALMLIATVDEKHIGNCSLNGIGQYRRYAHRCEVAIALYQKYCGTGIGKLMLERILTIAKKAGYEQAELEVIATNEYAINLYRKLGFEEYGKLSHKNLDDLRSGNRSLLVSGEDQKEDPLDFVLWKPKKEGEPFWVSPWGEGRPGWHIECSVMAKKYLGEEIDIHAGGEDLIFPHHENEIAQSECCNGKTFAHYWLHNGFLNIDNRKMSKSLGNFFTVREIGEQYDLQVLRFFMLSAHYRSPINFSREIMESSKNALERIVTAVSNLTHLAQEAAVDVLSDAEEKLLAEIPVYRKKLEDSMDDDLNTADAISAIFELVKFANTNANDASSGAFVTALKKEIVALSDVLGLQVEKKEENLDAEIEKMIEERQAARKARDFKRADEIRDELLAQGIILEDTREGVKWKRA